MVQEAAPWRGPLEEAVRAAGEGAWTVMQLATVKPDGRPSNRNLVYRGFLDGRDAIVFFGDRRTRKVGEASANPWGELLFWFAPSGQQFRLLGKVTMVTADTADPALQKARVAAWEAMPNSDPGRQHPTWPEPRSTPRVADESIFEERETSAAEVADNFMLAFVEPEEVDRYEFANNCRTIYTKQPDGSWAVQPVNP